MQQRWSIDELIDHWTLLPREQELLGNKTGTTRLGFALMLKAFQLDARFPASIGEVPAAVVDYVAQQVGVDPASIAEYNWRGRASSNHRSQVRTFCGFRQFTNEDAEVLTIWLCDSIIENEQRPEMVKTIALARLCDLRLEPPSTLRLERLVASALHRYETRVCEMVCGRLNGDGLAALDELLRSAAVEETPEVDEDTSGMSLFHPVLLSRGIRLFEGVEGPVGLEPTRVLESPGATHLRFRVVAPAVG